MATLTPKLTLAGTAADFGSAISLSVSDLLGVKAPLQSVSFKATAVSGGAKVDLDPAGGGNKYVYVKHTGKQADGTTDTANTLEVYVHDGSDARDIGRLKAEEFLFMPVLSASKIQVVSNSTQTIQVEYAYFTQT